MLVSLGTNQAIGAGSSATFTYSPNSLQKVFLRLEDPTGTHALTPTVTVQLGSKVICNGASAWGLVGITQLQANNNNSTGDNMLVLDFGSHECPTNNNLYVTVFSANAIDAVDCSALVDEPGLGIPVRITEYSDNTFTSDNSLCGISFASSQAETDEDAYNCEVRTALYSSAPSFISANSWYRSEEVSRLFDTNFGLIYKNDVPLRTTINYSASATTDRVITIEQDPVTRKDIAQGRQSARLARMQSGR